MSADIRPGQVWESLDGKRGITIEHTSDALGGIVRARILIAHEALRAHYRLVHDPEETPPMPERPDPADVGGEGR